MLPNLFLGFRKYNLKYGQKIGLGIPLSAILMIGTPIIYMKVKLMIYVLSCPFQIPILNHCRTISQYVLQWPRIVGPSLSLPLQIPLKVPMSIPLSLTRSHPCSSGCAQGAGFRREQLATSWASILVIAQ